MTKKKLQKEWDDKLASSGGDEDALATYRPYCSDTSDDGHRPRRTWEGSGWLNRDNAQRDLEIHQENWGCDPSLGGINQD